jgi:hypothetical protein
LNRGSTPSARWDRTGSAKRRGVFSREILCAVAGRPRQVAALRSPSKSATRANRSGCTRVLSRICRACHRGC